MERSYKSLDAWRGLTALWVVLFHTSQGIVLHDPTRKSSPIIAFGLHGDLGVHGFFVNWAFARKWLGSV
jgi:peptidoglycan/LPS O-acetylase OafA/YrhL